MPLHLRLPSYSCVPSFHRFLGRFKIQLLKLELLEVPSGYSLLTWRCRFTHAFVWQFHTFFPPGFENSKCYQFSWVMHSRNNFTSARFWITAMVQLWSSVPDLGEANVAFTFWSWKIHAIKVVLSWSVILNVQTPFRIVYRHDTCNLSLVTN